MRKMIFGILLILSSFCHAQQNTETKYYSEKGYVIVSWEARPDSEKVDYYLLYWGQDSTNLENKNSFGKFSEIMISDSIATKKVNLINATKIYFAVTAINKKGESPLSEKVEMLYVPGGAPLKVIIKRLKIGQEVKQ